MRRPSSATEHEQSAVSTHDRLQQQQHVPSHFVDSLRAAAHAPPGGAHDNDAESSLVVGARTSLVACQSVQWPGRVQTSKMRVKEVI